MTEHEHEPIKLTRNVVSFEVEPDPKLIGHKNCLGGYAGYAEKCTCGNWIPWKKDDIINKGPFSPNSYPEPLAVETKEQASRLMKQAFEKHSDDLIGLLALYRKAIALLGNSTGACSEANSYFTLTCPICNRSYTMHYKCKTQTPMHPAINWDLFTIYLKIPVKHNKHTSDALAEDAKREGFPNTDAFIEHIAKQVAEYETEFTFQLPTVALVGKDAMQTLYYETDNRLHQIKMSQKAEVNRLLQKLYKASTRLPDPHDIILTDRAGMPTLAKQQEREQRQWAEPLLASARQKLRNGGSVDDLTDEETRALSDSGVDLTKLAEFTHTKLTKDQEVS